MCAHSWGRGGWDELGDYTPRLPCWLNGKEFVCNAGDTSPILGWGDPLEKEIATYSSILAWEIPWTEEPDRQQPNSVQLSLSCVRLFATPRTAAHQPSCPSPTPGVYSNSCPLSRWCHPTISSSVVPFSSCPQSFPASGSSPVSQFFASSGQSIGVSASASVLPMTIQDWSPLGWTGWISLHSKDSQESSPTPQFKSINASVVSYSPWLQSMESQKSRTQFSD